MKNVSRRTAHEASQENIMNAKIRKVWHGKLRNPSPARILLTIEKIKSSSSLLIDVEKNHFFSDCIIQRVEKAPVLYSKWIQKQILKLVLIDV